jgi:hypothetical protein
MFRHIVFRILAGLILLAAIVGIAFFAYQAGAMHGAAANIQLPATGNGMPFYPHFWHPFFGFGIFGLLFGFFLLVLVFGAMRRLIFGPRWGWRHMGQGPMGSRMGHGPWSEGVPPMFAEWHRRAHANPEEPVDKKTGE